jgi:inositol-phosphate phosphatase/L-galactose 1-phosphate phosphatase/histidinol-phosphatase
VSQLNRCPGEFLEFAGVLADAVQPIVRRHFRANPETTQKSNQTPVTIADQQVETCLRAMIEARYPSHGIIGEEYGAVNLEADFVWVLDPIDGTHAFICGLPLFGTLISLTYCKRGLLGLMDQAISGERWLGARGHGATWNAQ